MIRTINAAARTVLKHGEPEKPGDSGFFTNVRDASLGRFYGSSVASDTSGPALREIGR